ARFLHRALPERGLSAQIPARDLRITGEEPRAVDAFAIGERDSQHIFVPGEPDAVSEVIAWPEAGVLFLGRLPARHGPAQREPARQAKTNYRCRAAIRRRCLYHRCARFVLRSA